MSNTKSRIAYGFTLNFPAKPFTIKSLCAHGAHPQYITAYMRVKAALKAGTIVAAGSKTPEAVRRGRKELVFKRANAKVATVSAVAATV